MHCNNSVFVSYAHLDSGAIRVRGFVHFLHNSLPNKISLLLDRKSLQIGKNIPNFMEQITECPVVIVLFTPEYKRRAESATGGVFREYEVIRSRYIDKERDFMLLPILFEGVRENAIPALFQNEVYYDYVGFHPKLYEDGDRVMLSNYNRQEYMPKFSEIAKQIESKIDVRITLPEKKYQEMLDKLFAKTKFTRKWIKEHPEFINHLFVSTRSYERVRTQDALFIIGRKGSGKSTISNTLPELECDCYKACIPILADNINLLSTITYIDPNKLTESFLLISDQYGEFS